MRTLLSFLPVSLSACCILFCKESPDFLLLPQDEQISLDKPSGVGGGLREPASLAHSAYSLAASAFSSSQDSQLYINGAGLSYGYRGFAGLGATMQHPVSLTTGTTAAAQTNGKEDGRGDHPFFTAGITAVLSWTLSWTLSWWQQPEPPIRLH